MSVFMPICHFLLCQVAMCRWGRLYVYIYQLLLILIYIYGFSLYMPYICTRYIIYNRCNKLYFCWVHCRLYILLCLLLGIMVCKAQTVVLPDSLFQSTVADVVADNNTIPQYDYPQFSFDSQLFEVAPAVKLEDYLTAPDMSDSFFYDLPELPSEFFLHVLVLHLSKVKIPGLEADLARYSMMLENFNKNLYKGGGYTIPYVPAIVSDVTSVAHSVVNSASGVVVYSGCLDPLEAYRRWVQECRLLRAKAIIHSLENDAMPTKEEQAAQNLSISPNLLQMTDDNYDVKVKKDGNNPPYRP